MTAAEDDAPAPASGASGQAWRADGSRTTPESLAALALASSPAVLAGSLGLAAAGLLAAFASGLLGDRLWGRGWVASLAVAVAAPGIPPLALLTVTLAAGLATAHLRLHLAFGFLWLAVLPTRAGAAVAIAGVAVLAAVQAATREPAPPRAGLPRSLAEATFLLAGLALVAASLAIPRLDTDAAVGLAGVAAAGCAAVLGALVAWRATDRPRLATVLAGIASLVPAAAAAALGATVSEAAAALFLTLACHLCAPAGLLGKRLHPWTRMWSQAAAACAVGLAVRLL
ncbi:MAG TPA: hypothetical protein VFH47_01290 [Candidatus Thermoplasmatota archaeon]|nr:hypothetical protein [Candidatus Thermoplasmatota archaeon]